MRFLPQRELRNQSGAVLRAVEAGESFAVTVDGRPVATLGPYRARQWVSSFAVEQLLATPTDPSSLEDVRALDEESLDDPWDRG